MPLLLTAALWTSLNTLTDIEEILEKEQQLHDRIVAELVMNKKVNK